MKSIYTFIAYSVIVSTALAQEAFVRKNRISVEGSHHISEVELAPRFLIETFGKPKEEDHQKVSGAYTFVGVKSGWVFTLYDWNSTSLSEYGADLPSPKEFWALASAAEFQIGGKDHDASEFKTWLLAKYEEWLQVRGKKSHTPSDKVTR